MNYFKIDNEHFFLAKLLGKKKKITLLKWIEYQNDATFNYEDHVKIAKKRDQAQYPFEITSNRLLFNRFCASHVWHLSVTHSLHEFITSLNELVIRCPF